MKITWCPEDPCKGVTCTRALTWYGHASMGMTKPVDPDQDKAEVIAAFAADIARSQVPGSDGRPRLVPAEAEFEVHHMVDPAGRQHWTALYSGEIPPMHLFDAAEPWTADGAERNAAAALDTLRTCVPRRHRQW